ncbi:MAG: hypothetical protein JWQ71_2038 [Pedosphaera sp.]|nr:hypothetical protein [Pedosphaera sp.]
MRKSSSPGALGFGVRDRRRLAKALAEVADARLFRRIQAVLLVAQGRRFREVAQITGLGHRPAPGSARHPAAPDSGGTAQLTLGTGLPHQCLDGSNLKAIASTSVISVPSGHGPCGSG